MCVGTNQIYSERQALQKQANQNAATQNQLARQYDQMLNGNKTFNGQAKQFDLKARNVTPTYETVRVASDQGAARAYELRTNPYAAFGGIGEAPRGDIGAPATFMVSGGASSAALKRMEKRSQPTYTTRQVQNGYNDATQNQMKNYLSNQQKQINNLKTQINQVKQQNAAIEAAANSTKTLSSRHPELTFKRLGYTDKQAADKAAATKGIKKPGGSRWWSQTILGKGDTSAPALSQRALLG